MKDKFIRIVDGFPDIIYSIDENFNLVVANRAAASFARKKIKNIIGKKCYKELYKIDAVCKNCPAEVSLKTNKAYFTAFKTLKKHYEIYSYTAGGASKEVILSYKDITREIKYEKEYLRYYNLINEIFDSLNDFIVMINKQGKIAAANTAFCKIFKRDYYSAINKKYKDVFPEKTAQAVKLNLKTRLDFEMNEGGKTYSAAVIPVFGGTSFIIRGTDITFLKKQENQIIQSEKMRALAELSAGVAHEFNNILTSILGYAQLMKQSEKYTLTAVDTIINSSFRAKKLIENMLTFSKKQEFHFEALSIKSVIEKTLLIMKQTLNEKSVRVEKKYSHRSKIKIDFNNMLQVFVNLILNAVQAGASRVSVVTDEDTENIMITVSDNGSGISNDVKTKIFDPFFTTKKTPRGELTSKGGTGLGLSAVYGIIKNHNGEIKVEDNAPKGAKFVISLKK